MFAGQRLRRLTAANLERRVPGRDSERERHELYYIAPASFPTRDASPPLVLAFCGSILWQRDLYYTTITLPIEYLTSYTNTSQLIDCQHFTQCKIQQMPPTRHLHTPHAATRYKHGRKILRHRGAEKSVAPTDFSAPLCRIIYCIRQNRLCSSGVKCVRCMQESVRYFEIILHS